MDSLKVQRDNSLLMLVDIQTKLADLCTTTPNWLQHCEWLVKIANELSIPLMVTEQYPQGLGGTVAQLSQLTTGKAFAKTHFSCLADPICFEFISKKKSKQLILIGIESHVCILQTALDAIQHGIPVFVVVDCISARHKLDHEMALQRMQQAGVHLVTREMVVFEWLNQAGTAEFKSISKNYLR